MIFILTIQCNKLAESIKRVEEDLLETAKAMGVNRELQDVLDAAKALLRIE